MKKALVILLTLALLLVNTAIAESWTVVVVGFDLANGQVVLEDEDGYLWNCPLGESDWSIGEEYQLVFTEEGAEIWECE